MSTFNWCHGPECHKRETTTRVRGVKGHKVLRTVKIALGYGYRQSVWQYFCDQTCMHDFIRKHIEEFVVANNDWLVDYALFRIIQKQQQGNSWHLWPEALKKREPKELNKIKNLTYTSLYPHPR